jgi:hypothetical protein
MCEIIARGQQGDLPMKWDHIYHHFGDNPGQRELNFTHFLAAIAILVGGASHYFLA